MPSHQEEPDCQRTPRAQTRLEVISVASTVVLVKAEMGQALRVAAALRRIRGVSMAHAVTGPHDVIAVAEAKTIEALGQFVVSKIQRTRGVKDTLTCLVVG